MTDDIEQMQDTFDRDQDDAAINGISPTRWRGISAH
jgi:hypothetical protein